MAAPAHRNREAQEDEARHSCPESLHPSRNDTWKVSCPACRRRASRAVCKPATAPLPMPSQTTFALTPTPVAVTVDGQTVNPEYAGGAPGEIAGLMQINVRIPRNITPGNAVPVTVEVQGYSTSQPGVSIVVGR